MSSLCGVRGELRSFCKAIQQQGADYVFLYETYTERVFVPKSVNNVPLEPSFATFDPSRNLSKSTAQNCKPGKSRQSSFGNLPTFARGASPEILFILEIFFLLCTLFL